MKLNIYPKGKKLRLNTDISVTQEQWAKMNKERLEDEKLKSIKEDLHEKLSKAQKLLKDLQRFSFQEFRKLYFNSSGAKTDKMDW